jgi:galactokinase
MSDLDKIADEIAKKRVRHVLTEIERVKQFVEAIKEKDYKVAGKLMVASHNSLRDDYGVSSPELDLVVETAMANGALGSRLTGAGFGGSAIVLIKESKIPHLIEKIKSAFKSKEFKEASYLIAVPSKGAHKNKGLW